MSFPSSNSIINLSESDITDKVVVELTFEDGSTLVTTYDEAESTYFENVVLCTYSFSNGDCAITASTCAGASAGFSACACAIGHPDFCGTTGNTIE